MPPHSPACHISRASQSHPLMTALPSSAPPLLAAHALTYSRNAIPILGPLHFHINPGEALIVQGPNGIGKTTLLRILAGLLHSDSGHIHINTHHNTTAPERTRHIAYLSHLPGLKQDLSALENLHFLNALHGCHPQRTPSNALTIVGLTDHAQTLVRQLSAGQKKRLSLARLWLSPAPLWLLDEPYANLDPEGITLLNHILTTHLHTQGGTLLTTPGARPTLPVPTRLLHLQKAP
ncbi:MAG: heme ABC exporter ATP-binding protein CcmA [Xylella fastidiosa subsp. multiplex]|uniref:heme ABC exporter ATP-binding protein CcmA n=2 Tax=Xylella fastidiosa TaxID=2371 RepID=UPI0036E9AA0F